MLLAGEWVDRTETMEVRNPENDQLVAIVPKASKTDMEQAIARAKEGRKHRLLFLFTSEWPF